MLPSWQSESPEQIRWKQWDDVYVVYHRPSGKTHLANWVTVALLTDVLNEPKCAADAAREIAAAQGYEPSDEFLQQIDDVIAQLEFLGLVRRARA